MSKQANWAGNLENAARLAMVNVDLEMEQNGDPLPPGPNYGPYGYFRLTILVFAAFVAVIAVINFLG